MSNGILIFTYFVVGIAGFALGAFVAAGVVAYFYVRKLIKKLDNLKVEIVDE